MPLSLVLVLGVDVVVVASSLVKCMYIFKTSDIYRVSFSFGVLHFVRSLRCKNMRRISRLCLALYVYLYEGTGNTVSDCFFVVAFFFIWFLLCVVVVFFSSF